MLALQSGKWAQIGWDRGLSNTSIREVFVQWWPNVGTYEARHFAAEPLGTYTKYEPRAIYGGFTFIANGLTQLTISDGTWHPNEVEVEGETLNYDDQMPGTAGAHEDLASTQISPDLRTWTSLTGTPNIEPYSGMTIYGAQKVAAGYYRIWDKDCLSCLATWCLP